MLSQSDGYDTTKKQREEDGLDRKEWTGKTGLRDRLGGPSWLLDTGSRMLRRRDCALTIDRKHPAALNLIHKAPAPVVTSCQSAIIEYGSCGMFCFFRT